MRAATRIGLVLAAAVLAGAGAVRADTLAVMPVKLLDSSQEARDQRAEHARRLATVGAALAADMKGPARGRRRSSSRRRRSRPPARARPRPA